jgi:hypothetical protein
MDFPSARLKALRRMVNPKKPRHVIVLHLGPVTSPLLAVRAAIVQEFRNAETAEGYEGEKATASKGKR